MKGKTAGKIALGALALLWVYEIITKDISYNREFNRAHQKTVKNLERMDYNREFNRAHQKTVKNLERMENTSLEESARHELALAGVKEAVVRAYKRLKTLSPNHELLQYGQIEEIKDSGYIFWFKLSKIKEWDNRFSRATYGTDVGFALRTERYTTKLDEAAEGLENPL